MITLVLIAIFVGFFVAAILVVAGHVIYDLWNKIKVEREIGKILRAKIEEVVAVNANYIQQHAHQNTLLRQLTELYEGALAREKESGTRPMQLSHDQIAMLVAAVTRHIENNKVN